MPSPPIPDSDRTEALVFDDHGRPLNAKVLVGYDGLVVLSRSGTSTNRDYRPALELLFKRIKSAHLRPTAYLDSAPVQNRPLAERLLAKPDELSGSPEDSFSLLLKRMNANSSSNGAYRRIFLALPHNTTERLLRIVTNTPPWGPRTPLVKPSRSGNTATDPDAPIPPETIKALTAAQLELAVRQLVAGTAQHDFSDITDYSVLLNDGSRLPPKAVVGVALQNALNRPVGWRAFKGGERTPAFAALRDAGYKIIRTRAGPLAKPRRPDPREEVEAILGHTPLSDEDRTFAEGNKKHAYHLKSERNPALVREKKKLFEAEHGRLFCEHCKEDFIEQFGDAAIARSCFDAHHKTTAVADMDEGHESQLQDLEILCATCHRAEHARLRRNAK